MQLGEGLNLISIEGVYGMSNWYNKLMEYFPEREMKSKEHFEKLLQEKQEIYQIMDDPDYIIVYFEQLDYIFIDYMLVKGNTRGKGVGSTALNEIKKKGKAIILEVEPITFEDPDSEKRVRFYHRNDFLKMDSIGYERIHMVSNELNIMDIYCWSPECVTEQWVLDRMKKIYTDVHAFQGKEIYGRDPQPVSDVLWLRESLEASKIIV